MAIKLISRKYNVFIDGYVKEYLVDTDTDFENLPEVCTGSTAVSLESGNVKVVNTQGEWVTFGG